MGKDGYDTLELEVRFGSPHALKVSFRVRHPHHHLLSQRTGPDGLSKLAKVMSTPPITSSLLGLTRSSTKRIRFSSNGSATTNVSSWFHRKTDDRALIGFMVRSCLPILALQSNSGTLFLSEMKMSWASMMLTRTGLYLYFPGVDVYPHISAMAKRKRERDSDEDDARPAHPETEEKRRLRSLALSRKLLRRTPSQPSVPLEPSKAVVKLHGRDLVKRGQRKSRYLFSFPGIIAPLSSGRIGELADLGTRNPVLYLEFPQGRMKLLGTHVYPKNKYLTLQLTKSAKGVTCEDVFESMIVFSDACWIGQKEENPEEHKLEFPKCFSEPGEDTIDYDFKGGAGSPVGEQANKTVNSKTESLPETEFEDTLSDDSDNKVEQGMKNVVATPVRQSSRTAGKKQSYAESFGDDSLSSDAEVPEIMVEKIENSFPISSTDVAATSEHVDVKTCSSDKLKQTSSQGLKENLSNKKGTLVQATLSNLFEKVADKKPKRGASTSPGTKGSASNRQKATSKKSTEQVKVKGSNKKEAKPSGKKSGKRNAISKQSEVPVEIEEISSESQDNSDEDWAM
ncbi:DNA-binding protein RHL1 isoform X3 [Canna indica]|uniref:DNA-binding protein RHL1 isoform X3 n=1 Tax=Canna indica TaxID=4628 RepID=A0AAQ3Q1C3_9LILI|nr:DNA-binding protein RHL1 isoform X3 [Canna indica]